MMKLQIQNWKTLFEIEKTQRSQKWSTIFGWSEIQSFQEKDFWEKEILKQFWKLFSALLYNLVVKIGKLILIGKLHNWLRLLML